LESWNEAQPLILKGERSLLLTRTVAMGETFHFCALVGMELEALQRTQHPRLRAGVSTRVQASVKTFICQG
jgi:hypothetical protein